MPALCELVPSVGEAFRREDLDALAEWMTPSEAECQAPDSGRPHPGFICEGKPTGTVVSGFTITGGGKQATLLSEAEFRERLASWLELPGQNGDTPKPVSVGCGISKAGTVDCRVTAVAIGFYNPRTDAIGSTIVLFFRKDYGGQPFGLVGGSGGMPDGAVLTGGIDRRHMAGWTGNETGAWYFELLD